MFLVKEEKMDNISRNQVLLGDSLEVLRTLPSSSIDCCVTSPVYFHQVDYGCEGQYGFEATIDEYLDRLTAVFAEVYRVLKNGSCCWIVIADSTNNCSPVRAKGQRRKPDEFHHRRPLQAGFREKEALNLPFRLIERLRSVSFLHRGVLIWDKITSGARASSDTAALTHEYILQFGKYESGGRPYLRCQPIASSVIRIPAVSDPVHPCPFPVALVETLLLNSTSPGDIVLDPFLGSGSTAIAAVKNGRDFVGIEINPEFKALAESRLNSDATNQNPRYQQSSPRPTCHKNSARGLHWGHWRFSRA